MNERQFFDLMLFYEGRLEELRIRINFPNGKSKVIRLSDLKLDYSSLESYFQGLFETEASQNPENEFRRGSLPSVEASTIEVVSLDKIEKKGVRVYCFIELGVKVTEIGNVRLDLIFASEKLDDPEKFGSLILQKINEDG